MREAIEQQLERLFTRFEFNDRFEIDIIAPKTWAAQWWTRFVLDDRLMGMDQFEVLELETAEFETAGQAVADAISNSKRRRILLIQLLDEGGDPQRWQPFFRRLNEVRNALMREFVGNLVLLVAPPLLRELVGEAPDLWSVAAVVSVGQAEPAELVDAMARRYPVLHRLTWMSPEELAEQLREHSLEVFASVLTRTTDNRLRARRAFELLGRHMDAPPLPRHRFEGLSVGCRRHLYFGIPPRRGHPQWRVEGIVNTLRDPVVASRPSSDPHAHAFDCRVVRCPGPPGQRDLEALVHARQAMPNEGRERDVYCCVMHAGLGTDGAETFARQNFDLLIMIPVPGVHSRSWSIEPGTLTHAPLLRLTDETRVEIVDDQAIVRDESLRVSRGAPQQPWLPGIDPEVLGVVPLQRA